MKIKASRCPRAYLGIGALRTDWDRRRWWCWPFGIWRCEFGVTGVFSGRWALKVDGRKQAGGVLVRVSKLGRSNKVGGVQVQVSMVLVVT